MRDVGVTLELLDSTRVWQEEGIFVVELCGVWQGEQDFTEELDLCIEAKAVELLDHVYTLASVVMQSIQG